MTPGQKNTNLSEENLFDIPRLSVPQALQEPGRRELDQPTGTLMWNEFRSSPVLKGVYARLGAAKSNDSTDDFL